MDSMLTSTLPYRLPTAPVPSAASVPSEAFTPTTTLLSGSPMASMPHPTTTALLLWADHDVTTTALLL
jgi:hypothetical protein